MIMSIDFTDRPLSHRSDSLADGLSRTDRTLLQNRPLPLESHVICAREADHDHEADVLIIGY